MKRSFIIFLLLAMAAGSASGQAATVVGSISGGFTSLLPDDKLNIDPYLWQWSREDDRRWQAQVEVRLRRETIGADFRFRADAVNPGIPDPNITPLTPWQNPGKAQGWVKAFDGQLQIIGGRIDDLTFETNGWRDVDLEEEWGFLFIGAPGLDGMTLNLGLGAYTDLTQSYDPAYKMKWDDVKFTFNALYQLDDVFKVTAAFRTPSAIDGVVKLPDGSFEPIESTWISTNNNSARAIFSAHYLAIPGLTANMEADFLNLDNFSKHGKFILSQAVGYNFIDTVGIPLHIQLNLGQYLLGDVLNKPKPGVYSPGLRFWFFAAWNGILDGAIVPRVDLNYFLAGNWGYGHYHSHLNQLYGTANFDKLDTMFDKDLTTYSHAYTANYDKNWSVFNIQPSVTFKFGSFSYIELGYVLNIDMNDSTNPMLNTPAAAPWKGTRINHVFYGGMKVQWW
jgi:hypothetical protein